MERNKTRNLRPAALHAHTHTLSSDLSRPPQPAAVLPWITRVAAHKHTDSKNQDSSMHIALTDTHTHTPAGTRMRRCASARRESASTDTQKRPRAGNNTKGGHLCFWGVQATKRDVNRLIGSKYCRRTVPPSQGREGGGDGEGKGEARRLQHCARRMFSQAATRSLPSSLPPKRQVNAKHGPEKEKKT